MYYELLTFGGNCTHLTVWVFRAGPNREELLQREHLAAARHGGEGALWTPRSVRGAQSSGRRRGDAGRSGGRGESRGAEVGLRLTGESERRAAASGRGRGARWCSVGGG